MKGFIKARKFVLLLLLPILYLSCSEGVKQKEKAPESYHKNFSSGPVQLDMNVDRIKIDTSGRVEVVLKAVGTKGWKPSFPPLPEKIDKFALGSVKDSSSLGKDDSITLTRTIILLPFLSGDYTIPSFFLEFKKGEKDSGTLTTDPVPVTVKTLLPENTDGLSIKGLKEPATFNTRRLLLIIGAALGVSAIGTFLFLFFRKRKKLQKKEEIPLFKKAFTEIDKLLSRNLPEKGEYKEFYFQLNAILRRYIEGKFFLRAPEQTTEEFLKDLSTSNVIDDEFKYLLREFLIHCDLVKFARHKPGEAEIAKSIESSRNFIRITGERAITEEEGEGV